MKAMVGVWLLSGAITMWLNPDFIHEFTFTKSPYTTLTRSFAPTQSSYTITMGGETGGDSGRNDYVKGVPWIVKGTKLPPLPGEEPYFWPIMDAYTNIGDYENAMEWSTRALKFAANCENISTYFEIYGLQKSHQQSLHFLDSICPAS